MHPLRTLSALTALAVCLAGCAGTGGAPSAVVTPQFVVPAESSAGSPQSSPQSSAAASPAPARTSPASKTSRSPSASPTPSRPTSSPAGTSDADVRYVFPVKASNVDYHPTHSKYPATDLFADCGEPVVATTSGVVLEVSLRDIYVEGSPDGPNNGGLFVSIRGDDGVRYYGSHLSKVTSGIRAGVRVRAGQSIGKLGRTGNANNVCHLHYGISPPCAGTGDWKVRRGVIWPAKFLDSWRKGGRKSPVATVAAWKSEHNCKA